MDKLRCTGCYDDHYNQPGNSNTGECWSLESAKLILRKEVSIDQCPPWNQKAKQLPSCYHRQRYVYVDPEVTR
jgi:hypothetical protein